jgi:hypothetical protein
MKTFKEFIDIAERYYEPHEPLPSGKTPYGKATSSYFRQSGEYFRSGEKRDPEHLNRLYRQLKGKYGPVSRGADNPTFDGKPDPSGRYEIDTDSDYKLTVRDTKNDTQMRVKQKDAIAPGGKPVYDVEWSNSDRGDGYRRKGYNPGQARSITRGVADMYKNQVVPRLPSNSVLTNYPIDNDTSERNTRAKFYSKVGGFGRVGMQGRQYAAVGRPPSPKQAAKGVQRITPLSGNLDPEYASSSYMRQTLKSLPKSPQEWASQEGKPRTIAPAKPSRPSLSRKAIEALKSTPKMTAPIIPKATPIPKVPKLKLGGGGKAALAGAAIAGAGALYNALQSKKK